MLCRTCRWRYKVVCKIGIDVERVPAIIIAVSETDLRYRVLGWLPYLHADAVSWCIVERHACSILSGQGRAGASRAHGTRPKITGGLAIPAW